MQRSPDGPGRFPAGAQGATYQGLTSAIFSGGLCDIVIILFPNSCSTLIWHAGGLKRLCARIVPVRPLLMNP